MATVNDILRATMTGTTLTAQVFNLVHHYKVTLGTELDYLVIAAAIVAAWDTAYGFIEGKLHSDTMSGEIEVSEWDFTNNEFDGKATLTCTSIVGADATDPTAGGLALVARFVTEELRRQGRKFVPGCTEANLSGATLSAALLVDMASYASSLNNDIIAGGVTLRPCTFNSTALSPRFETDSLFTPTAFVNARVGYQRRRQPGDGV